MPLTENAARTGLPDAPELAQLVSHPAVFVEPDRLASPPSWVEHIPFAFWLTAILQPRIFVELGTHSGNSYAALAQGVQHFGVDAAGYAIDTWKGDPQAGFYDEGVFTEWKEYHDSRYSAFSTLIRSTFDEALPHFADRSIDLLNIDGYHTVEAIEHDVQTWFPKVSTRGVVLMHDTNVRQADFGGWQVWRELSQRYPSFEFLHGHGLGVLAVGSEIPHEIRWLTGLGKSPSTVAVRQFFAGVGGGVLARYRRAESQQQAADGSLGRRLAEREKLAAEVTADRASREAEIDNLRTTLSDTRALLGVRGRELATRADELEAAKTTIADLESNLSGHVYVRRVQESMLRLPAHGVASAARRLANLQSRARGLGRLIEMQPPATRSRAGRLLGTLRALGISPRHLARHPRNIGTAIKLALRPRALRDAHVIAQNRVFDAGYYSRRYPDVATGGLTPLAHFVLAGAAEGRAPHPLFDTGWYLGRYQDVAAAGANPLVHYLRTATRETRDPHPLFSAVHYRSQMTPSDAQAIDPLQHYLAHGVFEERSPHPLFDLRFYVESYGTAVGGHDPLVHFLEAGAAAGYNPHPLFDTAYYRSQVAGEPARGNALLDYLQSGAANRRRPHPLFNPAFYLASYRDVAATGIEPLTHFVTTGGAEGRRPIPEFDSAWYLATYPDVARGGGNPLIHYLQHGWLERRNPSPHFDVVSYLVQSPDVSGAGMEPLGHYLQFGQREGRLGMTYRIADLQLELPHDERVWLKPTNLDGSASIERAIICLTHVMPVAPRAGNEYRIHRMLRWLRQSGYVVIPVVAPTGGLSLTRAEIDDIATTFGNAVICPPDGRVQYILRDVPDVLRTLDSEPPTRWATFLGEDRLGSERERELLGIDRSFCTDSVISAVLRLQSALGPYVFLAEYIWMSRVLPLVSPRALKIIDTIDVFSTRADKVGQYGIDDLAIEADEERARLARADLMIAIQDNERTVLENLAPGLITVTSGVDFDIVDSPGTPLGRTVLIVASGNPMNRRGLRDFLRFAWPRIRAAVPDARLQVVGAVGESVTIAPAGVEILGRVPDLTALYATCRAVINPAVAGTGVKIKTLEALSYLRPVVTWPNGVDGLPPAVAAMCQVVGDWYAFSDRVAEILMSERDAWFTDDERRTLEREANPAHVYAELDSYIRAFFAKGQPS